MKFALSVLPTHLWERIFGIPPQTASRIRQAHLVFATPWVLPLALTLLIFAALWFAWCYYRDGTRPSWLVKTPLLLLRLLAFFALMLMLAQPTLRLREEQRLRPSVAILVDTSQSMGLDDPRLPPTYAANEAQATALSPQEVRHLPRVARIQRLLEHDPLLKTLAKRYDLRLYTFASQAHALELPHDKNGTPTAFPLNIDRTGGDSTQIGTALHEVAQDLAGRPVAGLLVISDGENNQGEDPLTAAMEARALHTTVSTLGVGDPTKTKDIAVLGVLTDDNVRVHNVVNLYADLEQRGYAGKTVTVSLLRNGQPFQQQTVRLAPDDQKQEIVFTYVPDRPGRFVYTVRVPPQPGEITAANNARSAVQNVIQKPLKVLMVEERPRWEFRYLKNAILRDTSIQFACLLLSGDDINSGGEGNIKISGFPSDERTLFDYDILILGDVPRSYFSDAQLQLIRRFVEDRGGSLLLIAGENHMPQEFVGTVLDPLMPATFSSSPNPITTDDPFQWQLTPQGQESPIMRLDDDPTRNLQIWQSLPGMFWCEGAERVRPGAVVLAVNSARSNAYGPYPLALYQNFGAGKCYMDLADSTWRWRWRVGDRYFYRYWGQVIRFLTPRDLPGNQRFVQVATDRPGSSYRLGQQVSITVRLLDPYYHPVKVSSLAATIIGNNGVRQTIALQPSPNAPGLYTARYLPNLTGKYTISVTSPQNPSAKGTATFVVESLALELQKPELDEKMLKRIAAAGGGHYYRPNQLDDWLHSLKNRPLVVTSTRETELWNSPFFLALFIVPLTIEWLVRKRSGLL